MSRMVFDPQAGTFVTLDIYGRVDEGGLSMWEVEYVRTYVHYARWEPTSQKHIGRIIGIGNIASGFVEEMQARGDRVLVVDGELPDDGLLHYIDLKTMTAVPKAEPCVTIKGTTLYDVPAGSEIVVDEVRYPVKGKTKKVDLSFDQPGTYHVVVESLTHKDAVFKVEWS